MNCQNNSSQRVRICAKTAGALCFLVLLLAFSIGVIIGAVYAPTILPELSSVIAYAAALAAVIFAYIIYWLRRRY